MTNDLPSAIDHSAAGSARFAMAAIYVEDLQRSIDFYRLVGLDLPDPDPRRPVVVLREDGERRMIIATADVARRFDPAWNAPSAGRGYRQTNEFFVSSDAEVDAAWARLMSAGAVGISAPATPNGAYTALVRDPDGNVVMITHEP